ncbi:MAG: hypothetical protein O7B25_11640, partial [Gammaproteobacteria bacterium]|nr:hypothetical protein [Gammaproteobacteria bacterium]
MIRRSVALFVMLLSGLGWTNVNSNYPYLSCFEVASRLHNVPLDVLLAVAATESNWDPDARSDA